MLSSIDAAARKHGVTMTVLGNVTSNDVFVDGENWGSITEWKNEYDTAIEKHFTN